MASLTANVTAILSGDTTVVDTTQNHPLGTKAKDVNGNEYIYMQGVASVVLGSWVSFDEAHVTTRTVADAQGRLAVAMAAIDATTDFGWFCIYGSVSGLCLASFADNGKVYLTSTAGQVDDADVAGDAVHGAIGRSARDATSGLATFELNYSCVLDLAID